MKEYEKLEQQIQQQYESCTLCPRECRRNRNNGEIGFCKVSSNLKGARASLHMWEEPCISGEEGSGTVFFSGCNLGCVYCQNYNIAKGITGKEITTHRLSDIFLELQEKGANNINLVTPTHYLYHIKEAVLQAKKKGLHIPIVYNTSGYEKVESLKLLDGIVDIYLTDFKYLDGDIAKKYSRAEDYPEVAKEALKEMIRQVPECIFEEDKMKKGIIVRHLILPNYIKHSKDVLHYLYKTHGNSIYISIMNQYTPLKQVEKFPEINRKITEKEYEEVVDYAISIGIEQGFIQEGETADESFIPSFNCSGI